MVDRKKKEVQDLKVENQDLRTTVTQLFDTLEEVETELHAPPAWSQLK